MWEPISLAELEALVAEQLRFCTQPQAEAFARWRVPFHKVPIHRLGAIESVWVVAELPSGALYYEDVEEGFEIGAFGTDGALIEAGCNQYELTHILAQAGL